MRPRRRRRLPARSDSAPGRRGSPPGRRPARSRRSAAARSRRSTSTSKGISIWRSPARGHRAASCCASAAPDPSSPLGGRCCRRLALGGVRRLLASDLDRDGDPDLVAAGDDGLLLLDNLRQGRFADRTGAAELAGDRAALRRGEPPISTDGRPDLELVGRGRGWSTSSPQPWHGFEPWRCSPGCRRAFRRRDAFDADNDGRLDLALAGPAGVVVLGCAEPLAGAAPRAARDVRGSDRAHRVAGRADLDGDGDLELVAAGRAGRRLGGASRTAEATAITGWPSACADSSRATARTIASASVRRSSCAAAPPTSFARSTTRSPHFGLGSRSADRRCCASSGRTACRRTASRRAATNGSSRSRCSRAAARSSTPGPASASRSSPTCSGTRRSACRSRPASGQPGSRRARARRRTGGGGRVRTACG